MKPSHVLVPLLVGLLATACSHQEEAPPSAGAAAPLPVIAAGTPPGVGSTTPRPKCAVWSVNVYFAKNSYTMNDDAMKVADEAAGLFRQSNPAIMIVSGHTDATGSEKYNLIISAQRALAVKKALVDRGLPAKILATQADGASDPAVPTTGDEPKDRRVVITCRGPNDTRGLSEMVR